MKSFSYLLTATLLLSTSSLIAMDPNDPDAIRRATQSLFSKNNSSPEKFWENAQQTVKTLNALLSSPLPPLQIDDAKAKISTLKEELLSDTISDNERRIIRNQINALGYFLDVSTLPQEDQETQNMLINGALEELKEADKARLQLQQALAAPIPQAQQFEIPETKPSIVIENPTLAAEDYLNHIASSGLPTLTVDDYFNYISCNDNPFDDDLNSNYSLHNNKWKLDEVAIGAFGTAIQGVKLNNKAIFTGKVVTENDKKVACYSLAGFPPLKFFFKEEQKTKEEQAIPIPSLVPAIETELRPLEIMEKVLITTPEMNEKKVPQGGVNVFFGAPRPTLRPVSKSPVLEIPLPQDGESIKDMLQAHIYKNRDFFAQQPAEHIQIQPSQQVQVPNSFMDEINARVTSNPDDLAKRQATLERLSQPKKVQQNAEPLVFVPLRPTAARSLPQQALPDQNAEPLVFVPLRPTAARNLPQQALPEQKDKANPFGERAVLRKPNVDTKPTATSQSGENSNPFGPRGGFKKPATAQPAPVIDAAVPQQPAINPQPVVLPQPVVIHQPQMNGQANRPLPIPRALPTPPDSNK